MFIVKKRFAAIIIPVKVVSDCSAPDRLIFQKLEANLTTNA